MLDLTRGNSLRLIVRLSVPIMIGNLIQQAYNWVDSIMVGKMIGNDALAAVGSVGAIHTFIVGFLLGIAEGACILVARYFGAGMYDKMKKLVANIVYFCIAIAVVLTVFAVPFNRDILVIMKTPEDILELTAEYQKIIYYGMVASVIYNMGAGMLRALGDTRSPLIFLIAAALLNIVFNFIFIDFFDMGIRGAAFGTVFAQLISGLLCVVYIYKKCPVLIPDFKDLKLNFHLVGEISAMSVPLASQYSICAIGTLFIQTAINSLGSDSVLAFSVGEKLQGTSFTIMNSIGVAYANFGSQNIGAKKLKRVKDGLKSSLYLILGLSSLFSVVFIFFGKYISLIFLDEKTDEVMNLIETFFYIVGPFIVPLGLIAVYRNAIQGIGYSGTAMIAGLLELFGRCLIAFTLVKPLGFVGACLASPAAWVFADLFLIPMYYKIVKKLEVKYPDWVKD